MRKYSGLVFFLGLMLGCGIAFAQDDAQKSQSISFEDDTIEGELMVPNGTVVEVKKGDELPSLVKARDDFDNNVRKSVDGL